MRRGLSLYPDGNSLAFRSYVVEDCLSLDREKQWRGDGATFAVGQILSHHDLFSVFIQLFQYGRILISISKAPPKDLATAITDTVITVIGGGTDERDWQIR
jgi:hypothetical protein